VRLDCKGTARGEGIGHDGEREALEQRGQDMNGFVVLSRATACIVTGAAAHANPASATTSFSALATTAPLAACLGCPHGRGPRWTVIVLRHTGPQARRSGPNPLP
jgi:hypothetical protein